MLCPCSIVGVILSEAKDLLFFSPNVVEGAEESKSLAPLGMTNRYVHTNTDAAFLHSFWRAASPRRSIPSQASSSAGRPVNRSIRLAMGGWVENRLAKSIPSSGFTMNRCAVDGVAVIGRRREDMSSFFRAFASA